MLIHLLHVNDVHSALENHMRLGASLRRLRSALTAGGEPVLTFDVGDVLDRVRPETEGTLGMVNAALLAALGVDGWVFGNNEGLTVPAPVWPRLAARARTVVFGTNLRWRGRRVPGFRDHQVFRRAGLRIGVFGVTSNFELPYRVLGIEVSDPVAAAQAAVRRLREHGCDLVVALSHLGLRADRQLAAEVAGIDVIVGAHSHHFLEAPEWVGTTAIVQAGKHALAYGHTVLVFNQACGKVEEVRTRLIPTPLDGPFDAEMLAAYQGCVREAEARLAEEVLTLHRPLPVRYDAESPFANALAEILARVYPCDVALVHSGALTASLLPGRITLRHIHGACTTPTRPVRLTMTGEQLWQTVELSLQPAYYHRPGIGYGFRGAIVGTLAVANAEAEVRRTADGQTVLASLSVGGRPVEAHRRYRVVAPEYLWLAGLFPAFRAADAVEFEAPLMRELLVRHLADPDVLCKAFWPRFKMRSPSETGQAATE
ncbi:putative metallophosphoesterase YunD [Alicyclobacillus cellulosilyticus]|uniref:Metallophosphoesterase YunD n=1 Tax=Alicyclobacillus cellulosilyticus TaxID=1003997 RepID=A0A917NJN3_9BACL|nr:5'-nucleotidase C-terminal domain-containing protein [Alicyclobacillus cellulosilyticus]GGJ05634.1 putative metallophosphoesterase YunD [Alicyclobacillus cellulosilyticus]